tara:strand:- start:235 stop:405 length:171 start_codon:yes stop_codon:yes gene_type:complete
MKFNLDVKTLITLFTIATVLGGFYYSTQIRLDNLEENISAMEKKVNRLSRQIKKEK